MFARLKEALRPRGELIRFPISRENSFPAARLEQAAAHHTFPPYEHRGKTAHSDMYKMLYRFVELIKKYGYDRAQAQITQELIFDWIALGQEIKAISQQMSAFAVTFRQGQYWVERPNFEGGEDLIAWSRTAHEHPAITDLDEKHRYGLEGHQVADIFETLIKILEDLPGSSSPDYVVSYLQNRQDIQLAPTTIIVTKQLHTLFPHLREDQMIRVYASQHLLSISPPSHVHNEGKSSFAWNNRLIYIPEHNQFLILREGLYSGYSRQEVIEFLNFDQHRAESSMSDEELFTILALLPPEFIKTHTYTLLNMIVQNLGGMKKPPLIENVVPEMTLDPQTFVDVVLPIFKWELENYGHLPEMAALAKERLQEMVDKLLHHLSIDKPVNVAQAIEQYTSFYADRNHALNPKFHAVNFNRKYAKIYPFLGIKIDLSKLECGMGGMLEFKDGLLGGEGGMNAMSAVGLEYTDQKADLVAQYEKHTFQVEDWNEFQTIATQLGKDPNRFGNGSHGKEVGACQVKGCGTTSFLGECKVCLFCEVKDDWGIKGSMRGNSWWRRYDFDTDKNGENTVRDESLVGDDDPIKVKKLRSTVGISKFLVNDIYEDERTMTKQEIVEAPHQLRDRLRPVEPEMVTIWQAPMVEELSSAPTTVRSA